MEVKTEIGGTPLPQRPQKNAGGNQGGGMKNMKQGMSGPNQDGPMEKKPRYQNNGMNQNKGGFGGNKGFMNRNRNRNQNRGGGNMNNQMQNQNQQNQNQQQQQQQQQQQGNAGNQNNADVKAAIDGSGNQNKPANSEDKQNNKNNQQQGQNQQQHANQNQQQHANQNRGGGGGNNNRGGGGGGNFQQRDRNRGGGGGQRGQGGGQGGKDFRGADEFHIGNRLRAISGPTLDLPPLNNTEETKFSGRNRLYVGNLTSDITEAELIEMFKPYGEVGEIFCNAEKNFTFLKVDYHANAEKAKRELDGKMRKGRQLRIRFAPNSTILRVKNLTPFVSNELLHKAFEVFGPVERAVVIVDERGKHTGEGIVEFVKKAASNACLRFCNERCFFLTASLRPCVVEVFEANDDTDGLPEKALNRKTQEFTQERSIGPRCADIGSFEHEYGTRWKQLHELYKSKKEALDRELKLEEEKLEAQMEYARFEHETEMLRQELRKRESDNERKKMEWEIREKQAEEMRKRDDENMRRHTTEMQSRMVHLDEEFRRRQQENTLFMQVQQLNSMLDQQEGGFGNNNNFNNENFNANKSPFDFRGGNNNNNNGNANCNNMGNNGPNNGQDPNVFEFNGNQGQGNPRNNNGGNNNNNMQWERRRRF